MTPSRELKKGAQEAREIGWDAFCNGPRALYHWRDTIASYYGKSSWSEMTEDQQQEAAREFNNGKIEEEKNSFDTK